MYVFVRSRSVQLCDWLFTRRTASKPIRLKRTDLRHILLKRSSVIIFFWREGLLCIHKYPLNISNTTLIRAVGSWYWPILTFFVRMPLKIYSGWQKIFIKTHCLCIQLRLKEEVEFKLSLIQKVYLNSRRGFLICASRKYIDYILPGLWHNDSTFGWCSYEWVQRDTDGVWADRIWCVWSFRDIFSYIFVFQISFLKKQACIFFIKEPFMYYVRRILRKIFHHSCTWPYQRARNEVVSNVLCIY